MQQTFIRMIILTTYTMQPHIDGSWPGSGMCPKTDKYLFDAYGDRMSRLTFLIYLNDDAEGIFLFFFISFSCWFCMHLFLCAIQLIKLFFLYQTKLPKISENCYSVFGPNFGLTKRHQVKTRFVLNGFFQVELLPFLYLHMKLDLWTPTQ